MRNTYIDTKSYAIESAELTLFIERLEIVANRRKQTGHLIGVKSAWTEVDWTLPSSMLIVKVRANSEVHEALMQAFSPVASR